MKTFLEIVSEQPTTSFEAGVFVLQQDEPCDQVLVLLEGEVEVLRDNLRVARTAEAGAVFGEMSMLLGGFCTASVRTVSPAQFVVIKDPKTFFADSPVSCMHLAELLAHRLDALNRYLVDVKSQYEGHDHLGMIDSILGVLMHRQPRPKQPPSRVFELD